MIEIVYNENPKFFTLLYPIYSYIPLSYFTAHGEEAELYYLIDLFKEHNMLAVDSGVYFIWTIHFACQFNDLPFIMIYDTDYDIIDFSVGDPSNTVEIAEAVRDLIEKHKAIK